MNTIRCSSNFAAKGGIYFSLFLMLACLTCTASAADKVVLFNGHNLAGWRLPTGDWMTAAEVRLAPGDDQKFTLEPGQGVLVNGTQGRTVNLLTEAEFGDVEAHIEFCVPQKSNSGIYFMGRYEIQVFDSYGVAQDKYPGIECGGIYPRWANGKEYEGHSPRINASRPPGQWQTYDIVFRAPRFDDQGKKVKNAQFVKVVHNGKVIHENVELTGPTRAATFEKDEKPTGPIMLQGDHGPVAYRNLWLKRIDSNRPDTADNQPVEKEPRSNPVKRSESVKERVQDFVSDARILASAKAMLFDQKALQSKYLRVRVDNGVVFLDGFVRQPDEEELARQKLAEIPGVTKVISQCVIVPELGRQPEYETRISGPAEDLLLAGKIRAALLKAVADKTLPWEVSIVSVEVFKGAAKVFAVVPNSALSKTLSRLAQAVKGISRCQVYACPTAKV